MEDIVKGTNNGNSKSDDPKEPVLHDENKLIDKGKQMLSKLQNGNTYITPLKMPLAQLSSLGAGVSSLIPGFRTVTQSISVNGEGLYRIVNFQAGDYLPSSRNHDFFWASVRNADGKKEFAKVQAVNSLNGTIQTVTAFNPETLMIAMALFQIEQKLGDIEEIQKEILSFLEIEKESAIEADVQTLGNILRQYKDNWDNEHFVNGNYQIALAIKRASRKHIISYQKTVAKAIKGGKFFVLKKNVAAEKDELIKEFQYYRTSLYSYALASLIEILLSANYKEAYIADLKNEIETYALEYRQQFSNCSTHLEKMGEGSVDTNLMKGVGILGKTVGKCIERIPLIEKGPLDEFLEEKGSAIQKSADNMETEAVSEFAFLSNPGIRMIIENMNDLIRIYNHTTEICCDRENLYLLTE